MAETEAEALVRSGALYPRRIGLRGEDGPLVFAGLKRGAFSLYFGDDPIYHFDLEGRWQRVFRERDHFRKALDLTVDRIARVRTPEGLTLSRRNLSRIEIDELDEEVRAAALLVSERLGTGRYELIPPPDSAQAFAVGELHDLLDLVIAWDAPTWFAERERYVGVYGPGAAPFLPPDAQQAIVLNVGEGADRLTPEAFERHCDQVVKFLGRRAIQATTAYLGGESALRRPVAEIVANLDAIAARFPFRDESRPTQPRDLPPDRPSLAGLDVMFDFWGVGLRCRIMKVGLSWPGEGSGASRRRSAAAGGARRLGVHRGSEGGGRGRLDRLADRRGGFRRVESGDLGRKFAFVVAGRHRSSDAGWQSRRHGRPRGGTLDEPGARRKDHEIRHLEAVDVKRNPPRSAHRTVVSCAGFGV